MGFFSKSWGLVSMFPRKHLLSVVLVPALIAVSFVSYNRFVTQHDYMVTYEKDCDPAAESCYVGCVDEACEEQYTYALIEKHAADVYAQCGPDISDCEDAFTCTDSDTACSITYCDAETEADACAPTDTTDSNDSETLTEDSVKE